MITFPPAKINIGLRVTGKRPDGYHDLQTLFVQVPLCDALEILPSDRGLLWDDMPDIPEDNLVVKAYRAVQTLYPDLPPVRFYLRKRIPTGAGLGGGSSDATATLVMLNDLFGLKMSADTLHHLAKGLGADCPFFLKDRPHIAEGIGDLLEPYPLDLSGYWLTLVFPGLHISTKEAYAHVPVGAPEEDLRLSLQRPITEWSEWVTNDFEKSLFPTYPILSDIKDSLYSAGAIYAAMSGSGSAIYGISRAPLTVSQYDTKTIPL